jgi:hypothetical protein
MSLVAQRACIRHILLLINLDPSVITQTKHAVYSMVWYLIHHHFNGKHSTTTHIIIHYLVFTVYYMDIRAPLFSS